MKPTYWNLCARLAVGVVAALGLTSSAFGQESLEERLQRQEKQIEEIRKNAEVLQKQNEALMKLLNSPAAGQVSTRGNAPLGADDVRSIVSGYLQEKEAQKAAEAPAVDADGRYKIGSDLRMAATWRNGLVIATRNDDFTMHIGGWLQYDNVWWTQSNPMRAPQLGTRPGPKQGVAFGAPGGGIGDLQDGTYFRRIRLQTDGKFWENFEYTLTLAFENDQFSTVGLDEFWVGGTNIPFIGTVRFGHVKNAIGLEADMTGSSKVMTFMERSSYSEAIELNQNFVTGMWLGNNYFNQRATWSSTLFRADQASATGVFFGDGQWGAQGRITALPIYENDGRHLLHLGLSGGWRAGTNNIATSQYKTVQLRAREELRDDDPAGSPAGAQTIPNANSNRLIDTGAIVAPNDYLLGTEALYILGPLSIQGEYGWNFVGDAIGFAPAGSTITNALKSPQNYTFQGGYLQVAYTLTGENRSYDKRLGRLDSYYFGRKGNFSNAWFVRDEDGRLNWSLGAWELAARYSFTDLNDGTGLNRIQGGVMEGVSVGLNWYLNDNFKFQFDYVWDHRWDLTSITVPGFSRGLGMRMQFSY